MFDFRGCVTLLSAGVLNGSVAVKVGGTYFGAISEPCCIKDPIVNHSEFKRVNWFSSTGGSSIQFRGLSHSYGLNLRRKTASFYTGFKYDNTLSCFNPGWKTLMWLSKFITKLSQTNVQTKFWAAKGFCSFPRIMPIHIHDLEGWMSEVLLTSLREMLSSGRSESNLV